jgi:hypothetical protein
MPNTILKRWNGSAFEELYPKTTVGQISASGTASSSTFLRGDGQWAVPAGVDNFLNTTGDTSTGMQIFSTALTNNDDWLNSPVSIRERGLVGAGTGADNESPNLNFHWSTRQSRSLWFGADGRLNWGDYSAAGVPAADGVFRTGSFQSTVATGTSPLTVTSTTRVSNLNVATAGTADILTTARTIAIGTGAAGTATSFNGSANITIPITGVSESYLTWGGKHLSGQVTPIGMSLSNELSANRIAFINGAALDFEYSADSGTTWTNYNYTATQKSQWCTTAMSVTVGRISGEYFTTSRTRVTLTAQNGTTGYVYTNPRKMLINISSSGGMDVLVETRTGVNFQSSGAWSTVGTYSLSGWSGWNDIPLVLGTIGGGTTQTGNNWQLRLTFIMTSKNTTYPTTANVDAIRIFGENAWQVPSTLAGTNNLYSFDMSQNAFFPGTIQGTRLISTIATGTSPLTVASNTLVTNLNADLLDGIDSSRIVFGTNGTKTTTISNLNTPLASGFYESENGTGNPTATWYSVLNVRHTNSDNNYGFQFAGDFFNSNNIFYRSLQGNNPTAVSWNKLWHEGNDGTSSGLDADLLDGLHSSAFLRKDIGDVAVGNHEFYATATSGNYDTAAIEIREVNLVTNTQTADAYAPSLSWHWGGITAMKMFLAANGQLNVVGATSGQIWHSGNDGAASGLDADLLDGNHASAFLLTTARNAANGVAPLDVNSKVPVANLPDFITGAGRGFYLVGTISGAVSLSASGGLVSQLVALNGGDYENMYGYMWTAAAEVTLTWTDQTTVGPVFQYHVLTPGDEGDSTSPVTLEAGDMIVFTKYSDVAGNGDDQQFTFSVINSSDPRFANYVPLTGGNITGTLNVSNTIGVGTTTPLLNSTGKFIHIHSPDTNASAIHFTNNTTGSSAAAGLIIGRWNDAVGKNFIYTYNNEPISFGTNNLERMHILGNGNVGIGTASPARLLTVNGVSSASNGTPNVIVTTGTGVSADEQLQFGVLDGNYAWIQAIKPGSAFRNLLLNASGGNVGIATTTPSEKLEVVGNTKATTFVSTQATGTAPLTVASTTAVTNLNADLLDGNHASAFLLTSAVKEQLKYLYVYGKAQSAITKGQAVQFAGVQGDHILMKPAVPSEINTNPDYFIGLAEATLATNDFGYVLTQGELINVNTSIYTAGNILWFASAGSTAGALTATEPTGTNAKIQVGAVNKVNATEGIILTRMHILGVQIADIAASGTPSNTTFLRGDGSWSSVTASNVGLGNVTNESKATMFTNAALTSTPTAPTATAGTNTTQIATTAFVSTAVANLINSAPGALDTLDELAAALGDDANYAATITAALAGKAATSHTHPYSDLTGTVPTWNQNTTGSAATLTTARTLTIGSTGKTFNGGANVSWSLAEIGAQVAGSYAAATHTHAIADVTSLQTALDAKAATSHTHTVSNISDRGNIGNNLMLLQNTTAATRFVKLNPDHTVTLESDSTFKTSLGLSNVTNESKATMFASPTFTGTVSGVTAAMVGAAATSHTHAAADVNSGTFATARIPTLGNITNAGAIGSTSNLAVFTTTSGVLTTRTLSDNSALTQLSDSSTSAITERSVYYGTHKREIGVSSAIANSTSFTTITFTSGMRDFWLYIHQDSTTGSVIAQIPLTITSAQSIGTATPGKQHRVAWSNGTTTQVMNVDIFFSGTTMSFRHNFTGANLAFRWFGY